MVTTQQSDVARVLHLEAEEQLDGLERIVAAINIVAHEHVGGFGDLAAKLEQLEQVMELTMDVTADDGWGAHWLAVAFLHENLLGALTQVSVISLGQNFSVLHSLKFLVDVHIKLIMILIF